MLLQQHIHKCPTDNGHEAMRNEYIHPYVACMHGWMHSYAPKSCCHICMPQIFCELCAICGPAARLLRIVRWLLAGMPQSSMLQLPAALSVLLYHYFCHSESPIAKVANTIIKNPYVASTCWPSHLSASLAVKLVGWLVGWLNSIARSFAFLLWVSSLQQLYIIGILLLHCGDSKENKYYFPFQQKIFIRWFS